MCKKEDEIILTVKDERVAIPEVDEGRESLDAIPLGQLGILDLHHVDAVHVTLVINVLQLCQHRLTGPTVWLVCQEFWQWYVGSGDEKMRHVLLNI